MDFKRSSPDFKDLVSDLGVGCFLVALGLFLIVVATPFGLVRLACGRVAGLLRSPS